MVYPDLESKSPVSRQGVHGKTIVKVLQLPLCFVTKLGVDINGFPSSTPITDIESTEPIRFTPLS